MRLGGRRAVEIMVEAYHLNALPPGKMLHEYEILRVLGEGGFGIVYLTKGRYLDDLVAIKEYLPAQLATRVDGTTITPTSSANHDFFDWGRQKFLEEARMLSQLSTPRPHPNIVAVRRFFELHGTAYMVMDYEQGEPLSALLSREERLPEAQLLGLAEALLNGLETVHAAGITHRDVKPSNILVREDGSPVLLDFGAARLALSDRTQSTFNAASPAYAAPEQLTGSEKVGPWTDLYGLGATFYRAVTGDLPQPAVDRLVAEDHLPAAQRAGGDYAPGLLRAIDAALALKPEERPQSVAAWRALMAAPAETSETDLTVVLGAAVPGTAVPGTEGPAEETAPSPLPPAEDRTAEAPARPRRRRRLAAAVVFCSLFVVLGATFAAYQLDGWGDAAEQARLEAEETLRREAEAEAAALREAEAAARREAEELARREAEAAARQEAEAQALREAEAAARREAEEQAQREAEAAARREAEAQARREAAAAALREAEARARREAELAARQEAEAAAQREAERRAAEAEAAAAAQREAEARARREAEAAARREAEAAAQREAERLAKAAEEARLRAEAAVAVDRQLAELRTYMEQNRSAVEREFRAFATEGKLLEFRERFRRVISFGDVAFEDSEYRMDVHYSFCRVEQGGCQPTSREARVSVRFEDGKLRFLEVI